MLMSWRRSSWRGRRGIEVSKIDMSLNQKIHWHSGKCVYPGVVCLIRLFFFCIFFKYIEHFCRQSPFYVYSWPNTFNSSHGLTRSFSLSIKFCPLPICRFSHLQTLTPSHSQRRICPNLLTLISVVRNSQIFSPAVLQIFFSSCKLLARST